VSGETRRAEPADDEAGWAEPADDEAGRAPLAGRDQVRAALRATARIGPFFVLEVDGLAGQGCLPAAEWFGAGLAHWLDETARQLGSREPRVTASIAQLGFAARLWSPVLGCALAHGIVPDLADLMVSAERPVRLAVPRPDGWLAPTGRQLADLGHLTVSRQLGQLAAALPVPLAAGLLRGNSASAMIGALGVLARAMPAGRDQAVAVARALLASAELRGAGTLGAGTPGAGTPGAGAGAPGTGTPGTGTASAGTPGTGLPEFRRRSCCLYYRVPGGGLCGDCCLARRPNGRPADADGT
jgi:hypothetical protein